MSAIAVLRLKHKLSDINSIYEHFTKTESSSAEFYKVWSQQRGILQRLKRETRNFTKVEARNAEFYKGWGEKRGILQRLKRETWILQRLKRETRNFTKIETRNAEFYIDWSEKRGILQRLKQETLNFTTVEARNAAKEFTEYVMLQMIKNEIVINKKSPNGCDSFYSKLSTDNENINPSQQPATNTSSRLTNTRS